QQLAYYTDYSSPAYKAGQLAGEVISMLPGSQIWGLEGLRIVGMFFRAVDAAQAGDWAQVLVLVGSIGLTIASTATPCAFHRQVRVRVAPIHRLEIRGIAIDTTAEHEFLVRDKGWLPAGEVQAGDAVFGEGGVWLAVEASGATGEVDTVYNFEVEDYHTYFVG